MHGRPAFNELQQWVKTRYAAHAYPRRIHFIDRLPKTASGKNERAQLRRHVKKARPRLGRRERAHCPRPESLLPDTVDEVPKMENMISVEDHHGVAVIRLAHGKVSALDIELCHAITTTVRGHADAGAIVLTGTGPVFSAGVDLRRIRDGGASYVAEFLPMLDEAFLALSTPRDRSSPRSTATPSPADACWPPRAICA